MKKCATIETMNEKLPASTNGEDYRYESPYVTPSAATVTSSEASSGLYHYSAAGEVGAGVSGGPVSVVGGLKGSTSYHVATVPSEFGGTLNGNKGGSGVGGRGTSPHKQQKRHKKGVKNRYNGTYCTCFGGNNNGRGSDGGTARWQASFWPALLANFGICALLLGYVFIGSFVFLTIENSGRNTAATTDDDDAAALWHFAAQKSQAQATEDLLKQQYPQQQKRNHQLQEHQHQQHEEHQPHQQPQQLTSVSATWLAANKRHIHEGNATSRVEVERTTTTKTGNIQLDTPNRSSTAIDVEAYIGNNVHTDIHYKRQRRWQQQQQLKPRPRQQNNDDDSDYDDDLHALSMQNDEDGGDAGDEYRDVELPSGALAAVEDVERQRTVENIWEITVSLNILYKENWTKLAALEIQKFQDQLVKRLAMDLTLSSSAESETRDPNRLHAVTMHHQDAKQYKGHHQQHWSHYPDLHIYEEDSGRGGGGERRPRKPGQYQPKKLQNHFEWNFATAFLYSLTVITTVGYGSISPRSTLGRMVTIGYATIGIPLTLIYLSSIGAILAKLARLLCTQALCCCFCVRRQHSSRCCRCCYRALHASTKERELKLNQLRQQQQESIKLRAQQQQQHLAYCYVRPPAISAPHLQQQLPQQLQLQDVTGSSVAASDLLPHMLDASLDTLSVATTTTTSRVAHANPFGWSLLAPIGLCLLLMLCYVAVGAVAVAVLEDWPLLDGVYFCFMSLTTIGFCDLLPGVGSGERRSNTSAIWFCSAYILSGLTLTAMCVNVLHEEVLLRMRVVVKFKKVAAKETRERSFYGAPP